MSESSNLGSNAELVGRLWAGVVAGADENELGEIVSAGYVLRAHPLVHEREELGPGGLRDLGERLRAMFSDLGHEILEQLEAEDGRVVTRFTLVGVLPESGQPPVRAPGIGVSRVVDGKVVESLIAWDPTDVYMALGHLRDHGIKIPPW